MSGAEGLAVAHGPTTSGTGKGRRVRAERSLAGTTLDRKGFEFTLDFETEHITVRELIAVPYNEV